MKIVQKSALTILLCVQLIAGCQQDAAVAAQTANSIRIDHYVSHVSSVPAMSGFVAQLYVRERQVTDTLASNAGNGQVVLFVHGAGTPAEVAFDVPVPSFSWMEYLAQQGFGVFAMDMTGYGRSTRPLIMNDQCNLSAEQQQELFDESCSPSYSFAATTMASDWDDIDAVVMYLQKLRGVEKVHLVGWSQGGPRAAGYAALHPDKVANIVLLAPAYSRTLPATADQAAIAGTAMTKQSREDFFGNWDRQSSCTDQYDAQVAEVIWQDMLASDPVGASWGSGVRRAPRTPTFGWTTQEVSATQTPIMMVIGKLDGQVNPQAVSDFYDDLGSSQKVLLEMPCASHNAMWEKDAQQLYEASLQWLLNTSYSGSSSGKFVLEK